MDNVELLRTLGRMCDYFGKNNYGCARCGIFKMGSSRTDCVISLIKNAPGAIIVLEAWAAEHPAKTRAMDFFEKFPNAPKTEDGQPQVCAKYTGHVCSVSPCRPSMCLDCWNAPLEVEE